MIIGIDAQEPRVPHRGTIPFRLFDDNEDVIGPVVSTDVDRLVHPGRVLDAEEAVFAPDMPYPLVPDVVGTGFLDTIETIFSPLIARDQRSFAIAYIDADTILLPDIRIPGVLQPPLLAGDDLIFATPLQLGRGMLLAGIHFDLDLLSPAALSSPLTLLSGLVTAADSIFAASARIAIAPRFFLSDDFIPGLINTGFYRPSLVFDDGRPVTPVAIMDGLNSGVTVTGSGLIATRNAFSTQFITAYGVRSSLSLSKGKYYFEITINQTSGNQDAAGIMWDQTTLFGDIVAHISCTAVFHDRGVIWSNNTAYDYHLGDLQNGDVIGIAINLDDRFGWLRKNGGPWNGRIFDEVLPSPPPDPETGVGGVIIALGGWAPMACFGGNVRFGVPGDEMVLNCGQAHFIMPPPAGFGIWQVPSPFPPSATSDRFGVNAIGVPATFDSPGVNVTTTNGNLTATSTSSPAAAFSLSVQNYGKFYFEVTVLASHGELDSIGIANRFGNGQQTGSTIIFNSGNAQIWANFGNTGKSLGRNLVAGDLISVAVDLTDQTNTYGGSVWFRLNGGAWNGDVTADPVLGLGGVKNSGSSYAEVWSPTVGFNGPSTVHGDTMTANFGATTFAFNKPEGYAIWPTKILNVIQTLRFAAPMDDPDTFPVPLVDQSIKQLQVLNVVSAADVIFGASSFGGNLFVQANTVVQDQDVFFAPGSFGSLAGGLESANVTVSNSNQTATLTTSVNNTGARSINFQTDGKYYFEITADTVRSADCAGLLLSSGSYFNMVNDGTNCVTVFASGTIYSNGNSTGKSVGAIANATVLGFAIDLLFRKGWIRTPPGGLWNGDATANPATNVGGFNIGGGSFAPAVAFGGGGQVAGDQWTCNFGQRAMASAPPTGFNVGWPSGATLLLMVPNRITDSETFFAPAIFNFKQTVAAAVLADNEAILAAKLTTGAAATLDGIATNATLSNSNRTATHNTTTSNSGARSTTSKNTSKFYFEITVGQTTGASDVAGLLMSSGTYSDFIAATNCFSVTLSTGQIRGANFAQGTAFGPIVAGDVLGFAVNFDAQSGFGRGWISKNGGFWNNSSTDNPVTGSGGAIFTSGVNYAPAVGFGGSGTASGDNMTLNCGPGFTNTNANPAGYGDWIVPSSSTRATFDGIGSNVTLASGNLTVVHANTTNNSGARSASLKSTGKFYFEVAMTTLHGAFDCAGLVTMAGTFSNMVTDGTNSTVVYKDGRVWSNGANSSKTLGAIANGDVIGIAVDLGAARAWFRKGGGLWNGLAIGSENPATGTGGVTMSASYFAPAVGFGGSGTAANDEMTANFGDTAFQTAAPSGFVNWPAVTAGVPATLDGVAVDTTLSGGNLIATHANTNGSSGARSAALKIVGKFYFETKLNTGHGANDASGMLTSVGTYNSAMNSTAQCMEVLRSTGNTFPGGMSVGPIANGDVISWAVDLDARLAWVRRNNGLWNGDAAANPATAVNGMAMNFGNDGFAPFVGFHASGTAAGDQWTCNFGATAYAFTAPSGFGNWTA